MGFLSRFTGKAVPAKKAEDDALLVHAMMLMCGADGGFDAEEIETVKAYCAQLPELKEKEWDHLYSNAVKILRNYKDLNDIHPRPWWPVDPGPQEQVLPARRRHRHVER